MQLDGHGGEIIGGGIQLDEACVFLQETEAQTDDIADKHTDEQDTQRAAQKHLSNEFVARPHGFQQAYGRSAFNNDNQQHTDDRNACYQ